MWSDDIETRRVFREQDSHDDTGEVQQKTVLGLCNESERGSVMWYMKDYDFERPDSDFPGYEAYFTEGEISDSDEFMEVDDDFLDEYELSHDTGE